MARRGTSGHTLGTYKFYNMDQVVALALAAADRRAEARRSAA